MLKVVKTETGLVRGLPGNNTRITSFKGIPFAAPPVGENRWKAPQPAASWDGVRDCYTFGPIPMQDTPGIGGGIYDKEWHVDTEVPIGEDCLYLNIWTPANADTDRLPVLVWYFGGGFQWGYTNEMEFNGENLAKRGIVVVSVNYRLGAFGFIAHPEITKEGGPGKCANFGTLDQQAGLFWVKRNIAAFGGDPEKITIAGQSAGGGSVMNQLACKENEGVIKGALIMSGMIRNPFMRRDAILQPLTLADVEKKGESFFEFLGVKTLEEARKIDAETIRDKYAEFRNKAGFFAPCIDGTFLTDDPYSLMLDGRSLRVPMMSGNTADEFPSSVNAKDENEYKEIAKEIFGDKADKFLSFPEANVRTPLGFGNFSSIEYTVKGAFSRNDDLPCYYYRFDTDIPGEDHPGTFHSVDLWFFFETLAGSWRPFVGRHYDLARQICDYFANFIKTGDPNGIGRDGEPLPVWHPFTVAHRDEMVFTSFGSKPVVNDNPFTEFMTAFMGGKRQAFNPYLPSWEYVPDGEPYVFGDRVYVYGSHDFSKGQVFCLGDYVGWSAPVDNLADWRYEGVIYKRDADPYNGNNEMCLYAPDVTVGPDGRYYLYYVLDRVNVVSVCVCDEPTGEDKFLGYVHYPDGTKLGEKEGDEPQFDPGVMTIGDETYLFTGFAGHNDASRHGAMLTVLDKDMMTVKKAPRFVAPGDVYEKGTGFEGHAFFEAPSIRERNGKYYFVYSSSPMHELCYAMSDTIDGEYKYGGVIVSNADIGIDSYKPADKPTAYGANNHGSIVEINGEWYIFYHRQTNGTWFSRQVCAEKINFTEDGHIIQAEITSAGLNGGPLKGHGEYPAYIVCNMFNDHESMYVGGETQPRVVQDGRDGDRLKGYIDNITDNTTVGFKYFELKGLKSISFDLRGYFHGNIEFRTSLDGDPIAVSPRFESSSKWERHTMDVSIPDGVYALYFTYKGDGNVRMKSFILND